MFKRVTFQGVRILRDVTADLAPLTFVVGPNGCGKSTLLNQIERLCAFTQGEVDRHALGRVGHQLAGLSLPTERTHGEAGPLRWAGEAVGGDSLEVVVGHPHHAWWEDTRLTLHAEGQRLTLSDSDPIERRRAFDAALDAPGWRAQRLRLAPRAIATPVDLRVLSLDPSGHGLASVLTTLAVNDPPAYAALQDDLRAVVPPFERLHLRRVEVQGAEGVAHGGVALGMVMRGAGELPAEAVSDGTLLALALLTATHHPELPSLVLMDDLDHGLHLTAQAALVRAIRAVMARRPALQVICTTHSPYLLDAAAPEEVLVMAIDARGHARVRALSEHPEAARYQGSLLAGELWASLGEDWVVAP